MPLAPADEDVRRSARSIRLRQSLPVAVVAALLCAACGKKGPPLPPLVKLPVAPADFTAARRGDAVDLQLTVPGTNTDRSKPAYLSRIDVYALTAPTAASDIEVVARGTKVASVDVKAPRSPEATSDPDEEPEDPDAAAGDIEPPEGKGLDQGAIAKFHDVLSSVARAETSAARVEPQTAGPLLGPQPAQAPSRTYVTVGVTPKGRRGPLSKRVVVPLTASPAPPAPPMLEYTESAVMVSWPTAAPAAMQEKLEEGMLPARLVGIAMPRLAYRVYQVPPPSDVAGRNEGQSAKEEPAAPAEASPAEVSPADATLSAPAASDAVASPAARKPSGEQLLTSSPIAGTSYHDTRMTWGATKCYAITAVQIVDTLAIESDASEPACTKLVDTFAPAAPKGLTLVASGNGAMDLIWDANTEPDLEGYIVLRGAPGGPLARITPMPIHDTNFRDTVPPGGRYVYVLQAVDKSGNISTQSDPQEEMAR